MVEYSVESQWDWGWLANGLAWAELLLGWDLLGLGLGVGQGPWEKGRAVHWVLGFSGSAPRECWPGSPETSWCAHLWGAKANGDLGLSQRGCGWWVAPRWEFWFPHGCPSAPTWGKGGAPPSRFLTCCWEWVWGDWCWCQSGSWHPCVGAWSCPSPCSPLLPLPFNYCTLHTPQGVYGGCGWSAGLLYCGPVLHLLLTNWPSSKFIYTVDD